MGKNEYVLEMIPDFQLRNRGASSHGALLHNRSQTALEAESKVSFPR